MGEVGIMTPAAELAAREPPNSLSAFRLVVQSPIGRAKAQHWVDFAVSCKSCGRGDFNVGWFPLVAPDPSPYFDTKPGEALQRPPHRLRCVHCETVGTIFDPRVDGYDGIACGGCAYPSGTTGEQFTGEPFNIVVCLTYNFELAELLECAQEAGPTVKAADLFDWLTIIATPVDGGSKLELSYECA